MQKKTTSSNYLQSQSKATPLNVQLVGVLYGQVKHAEYEVEVEYEVASGLPVYGTEILADALRSLICNIDTANSIDIHHWHKGEENLPSNGKMKSLLQKGN